MVMKKYCLMMAVFSAGMLFTSCSKEEDFEIGSYPKTIHPMEPSIEECDVVNDSLMVTDAFIIK